jgi:hypothetical protein
MSKLFMELTRKYQDLQKGIDNLTETQGGSRKIFHGSKGLVRKNRSKATRRRPRGIKHATRKSKARKA